MSDKWQQINLRLDADLAQALRELKQGHDESVSEVVLRLLKKVVRQTLGASGVPAGRSSFKPPRGAVRGGGGRPGKPAPGGRAAPRGPAGKPWAAPAAGVAERGKRAPAWGAAAPAADGAEGDKRGQAWGSAAPRGARRIGGKPGKAARPQPFDGAREPRRPNFRAGTERPRAPRPSAERGTAKEGLKRPRKAKGRRTAGR